MEELVHDTFTGLVFNIDGSVWGIGVAIPTDISNKYIQQKVKRVVCTLKKSETYQCALMPNGNNQYFININKELQKKLSIKEGDEVHVKIKPDTSKYGLPLPEELEAIFEIDEDGSHFFHQLTPGKQRTLLHLVGKPKSADIRIKKAMVIVEYLKEVQGKLDFKELNAAFKRANEKQY